MFLLRALFRGVGKYKISIYLCEKVIFDSEQLIFVDFEGCECMCACVFWVFEGFMEFVTMFPSKRL